MSFSKLSKITFLLATVLIAASTSACGQGKPKRMVRGPSVTVLVPESPSVKEDGISQIIFGEIYKEGETEYTQIGSGALRNAPPLPTGHILFRDLVFRLKTEAIISGHQLTVFYLPSVESQTDFNRLRILHLEDDEMSPSGRSWAPVDVFPNGWQEHFNSVSKAQYDAVQPDFRSKRITAISEQFGLFVIALAPTTQIQTTAPFTTIDIETSSTPEPVTSGQEFAHRIVIKNNGQKPAAEVNLKEEFHTDFDYVSATSSQGTCKESNQSNGRVLCHLGVMPAGATATIRIALRVRRNLSWNENEGLSKSLNIIELVFKEKSTDFVVMENQIFKEIPTTIIRDR